MRGRDNDSLCCSVTAQLLPVSPLPRALTIAGSDSGGGAGVQADLKVFQELDVYGMSVLTAVTAQNSLGVQAVFALEAHQVQAQLDAVLHDIGADVVKIGMLGSRAIVTSVAERLRHYRYYRHYQHYRLCSQPFIVVDPVLAASDGTPLLAQDAQQALQEEILSQADVITPNVPEACQLLGLAPHAIRTLEEMRQAAHALLDLGCRYVLLKGGHLEQQPVAGKVVDVLIGKGWASPLLLEGTAIATRDTHGTGCVTAAALAAYLAQGLQVQAAARAAKIFVQEAIAHAFPLGQGRGTLRLSAHRQGFCRGK